MKDFIDRHVDITFVLMLFALIAWATLSGCASTSTKSLADRTLIAQENWNTCCLAYKYNNRATVTRHTHRRGRKHRLHEIEQDLSDNRCRLILGKYWISQ